MDGPDDGRDSHHFDPDPSRGLDDPRDGTTDTMDLGTQLPEVKV